MRTFNPRIISSRTLSSRTVSERSFLHPVASSFISRASISDATQITAINDLCVSLDDSGVLGNIIAFYPIVGGTSSSHAQNLISSSYTITWSGTVTHDSGGVRSNGTTGYGRCVGLTPQKIGNRGFLGAYLREPDTTQAILTRYTGISDGVDNFVLDYRADATQQRGIYGGTTAIATTVAASAGFFSANRSSQTGLFLYKNGSQIGTSSTSTTTNAFSNLDFYVLALNGNGTAGGFSSKYFAGFVYGFSLSSGQMMSLYNAIQDFNTALNRQV